MEPIKLLKDHKQNLVNKWFSVVIDTYPKESAHFFKDNSDPFANPVGNTIKRSLTLLFDEVIKEKFDAESAGDALEPIIRIRAVQEFVPSQAVSFILSIKQIIAKDLSSSRKEKSVETYLGIIDSNVSQLMLMAFDIYLTCKQKIYSLRINESKQRVRQLLIKKGLMGELPDTETEAKSLSK